MRLCFQISPFCAPHSLQIPVSYHRDYHEFDFDSDLIDAVCPMTDLDHLIAQHGTEEALNKLDKPKPMDNTVRLEASTLNEIFKSANYNLDEVRKTKRVKPIYISVLPAEINSIESTKEKKDLFIKIILLL